MHSPVYCNYAPPGEFIKDHTLLFHDGWWHLFSISGVEGYWHACNGNEETFSWSISRDLVHWEMRGHVLHASQRAGAFDQHEVWAPNVVKAKGRFFLFYTGIVHPHRPMIYDKPGPDHPWIYEGHRETIGIAVATDLTDWTKVSDFARGAGVPGRDPHVVWDEDGERWLLYTTGGRSEDGRHHVYVSSSTDLLAWKIEGTCAWFSDLPDHRQGNNESLTVMRHPVDGNWIMLANWQYQVSDDPLHFPPGAARVYPARLESPPVNIGLAGEMIEWQGRWYRSGFFGAAHENATRLGFTEIEWVSGGAFRLVEPSILAR